MAMASATCGLRLVQRRAVSAARGTLEEGTSVLVLIGISRPGGFWLEASSGSDSSITGSLILYFSLAQLPRSRQPAALAAEREIGRDSESVGFRQMGHCHFICQEYF